MSCRRRSAVENVRLLLSYGLRAIDEPSHIWRLFRMPDHHVLAQVLARRTRILADMVVLVSFSKRPEGT